MMSVKCTSQKFTAKLKFRLLIVDRQVCVEPKFVNYYRYFFFILATFRFRYQDIRPLTQHSMDETTHYYNEPAD